MIHIEQCLRHCMLGQCSGNLEKLKSCLWGMWLGCVAMAWDMKTSLATCWATRENRVSDLVNPRLQFLMTIYCCIHSRKFVDFALVDDDSHFPNTAKPGDSAKCLTQSVVTQKTLRFVEPPTSTFLRLFRRQPQTFQTKDERRKSTQYQRTFLREKCNSMRPCYLTKA